MHRPPVVDLDEPHSSLQQSPCYSPQQQQHPTKILASFPTVPSFDQGNPLDAGALDASLGSGQFDNTQRSLNGSESFSYPQQHTHNKVKDAASEMIPGFLILGSARAAADAKMMKDLGITRYLCVAKEAALPTHVGEELLESGEVQIKHIQMVDGAKTQLQEHFNEAFSFIRAAKRARRRLIVYCREGKSRSASIVIAYFIRYFHMSYEEALAAVRCRRTVVDPNFAFCTQLSHYAENFEASDSAPPSVLPSPRFLAHSPARSRRGSQSDLFQLSAASTPHLLDLHVGPPGMGSGSGPSILGASASPSPRAGAGLDHEKGGLNLQLPSALRLNRSTLDSSFSTSGNATLNQESYEEQIGTVTPILLALPGGTMASLHMHPPPAINIEDDHLGGGAGSHRYDHPEGQDDDGLAPMQFFQLGAARSTTPMDVQSEPTVVDDDIDVLNLLSPNTTMQLARNASGEF